MKKPLLIMYIFYSKGKNKKVTVKCNYMEGID